MNDVALDKLLNEIVSDMVDSSRPSKARDLIERALQKESGEARDRVQHLEDILVAIWHDWARRTYLEDGLQKLTPGPHPSMERVQVALREAGLIDEHGQIQPENR